MSIEIDDFDHDDHDWIYLTISWTFLHITQIGEINSIIKPYF